MLLLLLNLPYTIYLSKLRMESISIEITIITKYVNASDK